MAYIGKTPAIGNFVKLDAITTSSTNTYNLTSSSVAFTPESSNHCIVSLNGVIQAPSTAYSVSGSTITFIPASGTLSSSDTIDFILVLGNVLDIGTPSDDTVSTAKLQANAVTTAKITDANITTAKIANDAVDKDKVNFISDSTAGVEVKGDGGSNDGYIQLNCSQNSHGVKIKSPPHSAGQSYTLTLPQSITNDYYLKTDGSGNLSFSQVSSDFVKIKTIDASDVSSVVMVHGSNSVVFDGTYAQYHLKIMNYVHNGTNDNLQIRVTTDGTNYLTSGYNTQTFRAYYSGNTDSYSNYTDSVWRWNFGGAASTTNAAAQQADVFISNPTLNNFPDFRGFFWGAETSQSLLGMARGRYQTSGTITGFQLTQPNGANFSGKFVLYGFKD